jgi:DNA-binding transcriptional ArsR family regulator
VNVRADCDDAIADLVDVLAASEPGRADALTAWGRRTERVLSPVRGDGTTDERLAYARLEVLRLRAALDAAAPRPAPAPTAPRPPAVPLSELTPSQRKVFERVSAGPSRSGALIEALTGQLSPRTVKRSLKELTGLGLVIRRKHDGQVEYQKVA